MVRSRGRVRGGWVAAGVAALLGLGYVVPAAWAQQPPPLAFSSPGEGVEIVGKRPVLRFEVDIPHREGSLLVLVDGVDVTGAVDLTPGGFEYRPIQLLAAGDHYLEVVVTREDGTEAHGNYTFSSRHSRAFSSVYSTNEASVVYERMVEKPEQDSYTADQKTEGNFSSTTVLQEGGWETSFTTNLRYLDTSLPVMEPEKKGINLVSYLLSTRYAGEHLGFVAEVGDLQVQETQNTVASLARRGARVEAAYRALALRAFLVNSEQVFGFTGGTGLEMDDDQQIQGVTAQLSLFSNALNLRTIYVAGGESGDSFGIYTEEGAKKGDVRGVAMDAQLFSGGLNLRAEYDRAEFDADTTDEFSATTDRAWAVGGNGYLGMLGYDFVYEYMGPDYEVIGNQGLQRDRKGFGVRGDLQGQTQMLSLSASRYLDNVEKDELFPQVESTQIAVDYNLSLFPSFPIGVSYQRADFDTKMLPEFGWPVDSSTEVFAGNVSYLMGNWNVGLYVQHQTQDDRTEADADTRATSCSFAPSYYAEHLSLAPNFSFNRAVYENTGVRTDTYTLNLDLQGVLFQGGLSYGLAGTVNRARSDDGFTDLDTLNANARLAWTLFEALWGVRNPTVGLRGLYAWSEDKVYETKTRDLTVLLVLSTGLGFSL